MGYLGRTPTPSPIDSSDIPANSIDASKIIDGAIAVADVADNAITEAKIADAAVVSLKSGRKNLIINGGFDVWQRGTPRVTTEYCADRWMVWSTNAGVTNRTVTATKGTGSIAGLGYKAKYTSFSFGTVDTGIEKLAWGQKIEASSLNNINVGDSLTLSYYIKKEQSMPTDNSFYTRILTPSPSGTDAWVAGYLWQNDETIAATLNTTTFNSLSTSWTKVSHTFTATATMISDGMAVYWHVGDNNMNVTSTSALVSFTGVQLELGSVATDFEHRSYGEELALCKRYYQLNGYTYAVWVDSTGIRFANPFDIEMRAAPTATLSGLANYHEYINISGYNGFSSLTSWSTKEGANIKLISSAVSDRLHGQAGLVHSNCVAFDAEL